jgi:hypothetical protein
MHNGGKPASGNCSMVGIKIEGPGKYFVQKSAAKISAKKGDQVQ